MHSKSKLRKKSAESGLDLLFTVYSVYRHPPKTSLSDTSEQAKWRSFLHGALDAASELQNDADGAEKWREWALPELPRVPKSAPMPPKMLQKIIKNQDPSPGLPPRVLLGCLGYPSAPKIRDGGPRGAPVTARTFIFSAPALCAASLERGGLGVCPLG